MVVNGGPRFPPKPRISRRATARYATLAGAGAARDRRGYIGNVYYGLQA